MKKVFIILAMILVTITAAGQDVTLNENGVYEQRRVVTVDSTKQEVLYTRTLEALSDWSTVEGMTTTSMDVQDKEQGLVIAKGLQKMGNWRLLAADWTVSISVTVKVRCKDGKALVVVTVPSMRFVLNGGYAMDTIEMDKILPKWTYKGALNCKRAAQKYIKEIPAAVSDIVEYVSGSIEHGSKDEDF